MKYLLQGDGNTVIINAKNLLELYEKVFTYFETPLNEFIDIIGDNYDCSLIPMEEITEI